MKAFSPQYWLQKWSPLVRPIRSVPKRSNWKSIELFPQPTIATVDLTIADDRPGRVKYQSSYWPARFLDSPSDSSCTIALKPKDEVMVVGREGLTLLVTPIALNN